LLLFKIWGYRKKLIIQYFAMDGGKKKERNIGFFKIVGELNGEKMADSK